MKRAKQIWFRIPARIRRPVILVVGMCFVTASLLTGWLPGPGGLPLFIIGVTILSTEYHWAKRFRDFTLQKIKQIGIWYRQNRLVGTLIGAVGLVAVASLSYLLYTKVFY